MLVIIFILSYFYYFNQFLNLNTFRYTYSLLTLCHSISSSNFKYFPRKKAKQNNPTKNQYNNISYKEKRQTITLTKEIKNCNQIKANPGKKTLVVHCMLNS